MGVPLCLVHGDSMFFYLLILVEAVIVIPSVRLALYKFVTYFILTPLMVSGRWCNPPCPHDGRVATPEMSLRSLCLVWVPGVK